MWVAAGRWQLAGGSCEAETQHYLQQLDRVGLLADTADPVGETVQDVNLVLTRLDLLPVCLEGKLGILIDEFLGQDFLFIK